MTTKKSDTPSKPQESTAFDFLSEQELPTRTDFLWEVSKRLAELRRHKEWTQEKLNAMLGIADRLLNKWECGDKTPSGFSLYCWADSLGERLATIPKDTVYAEFTLSDGDIIKRHLSADRDTEQQAKSERGTDG